MPEKIVYDPFNGEVPATDVFTRVDLDRIFEEAWSRLYVAWFDERLLAHGLDSGKPA